MLLNNSPAKMLFASKRRRRERKNISISFQTFVLLREKLGRILILLFLFTGVLSLPAQTLSGNLDTKITLGAGNKADFFYGAEEYANLRLKIPAGEYAVVYSAFNLIAAAGSSANYIKNASGTGSIGSYYIEENYLAVMELERLYVQISGDTLGLSAGLLRIPFGYGLVWKPIDFLNPQNPLEPDARFRGVLGIVSSFFPVKYPDMKFLVFAATPHDPFNSGGTRAGFSWENHWQRASMQLLYCFESPVNEYAWGLHRAGLSFKADLELGLIAELFYTFNPAKNRGIKTFSASFGADYSLFDGKLYVLAEYLFVGNEQAETSNAALPDSYTGCHFLYGAGTWKWSDFSSITLGCSINLEGFSCTPLVFWQYEFIQGMIFSLRVNAPLNKDSFNAYVTAGLRVKF